MKEKKNYYSVLKFIGREDLHMTLCYYLGKSEEEFAEIVEMTNKVIETIYHWGTTLDESWIGATSIKLKGECWLGINRHIRTLVSLEPLPKQIELIRVSVPGNSGFKNFKPHVTCEDPPGLELNAYSLVLAHKGETLESWSI